MLILSKKNFVKGIICSLSALVIFLSADKSFPNGIAIDGMSSEGHARAEAITATIDNAAAVWYNPARLTKIEDGKIDLRVSSNNKFINITYADGSNNTLSSSKNFFFLPAIYTAGKINDKIALGFGLNSPYGASTGYDKNGPFRYITTGGTIKLLNASPTVAFKVSNSFSAAVGANIYSSEAELGAQYPWAAIETSLGLTPASPDGKYTLRGEGHGFGFNAGFNFDISDKQSLGLVYRSQVVVKYDDREATLTGVPAALQSSFSNKEVYRTDASTQFKFPDSIVVGYAFKPTKALTIETNLFWWDWSDYRNLVINLENEVPGLLTDTATESNWIDGWSGALSFKYKATETFSFSGGYRFSRTPTIDSTYSPLIPDNNYHYFTTGVKYTRGNFTIEIPLAFATSWGNDNIDSDTTDVYGLGQTVDGKYKFNTYEFGFNLGYRF